MNMPKNPPAVNIEAIAVHEAVHAVVARVAGMPVVSVAIAESEDDGTCAYQCWDGSSIDLESIHTRQIVSAAGYTAEVMLLGVEPCFEDFTHKDFVHILDWLELLERIAKIDKQQCFDTYVIAALELVENNQSEIKAVAKALIEKKQLTGDEVDQIVERVRNEAT